MAETFYVSLDLQGTKEVISKADCGLLGLRIGFIEGTGENGSGFALFVYEKHFLRAGSYLTLTVSLDDTEGRTRVYCASGGGRQGAGGDFGASDKYESLLIEMLNEWRV